MQNSFVYILKCADHTFYVGVTTNIEQRLQEHQQGKYDGSYTSRRLPVELLFYCQFMDINLAIEFEKKIKKWSHAKKQALIEGRFQDLPNLARKNFKK